MATKKKTAKKKTSKKKTKKKSAKKTPAKKKAPAKMGRPLRYNKAIGEEVCKRIAKGESLRSICDKETMPCRSTVVKWLISSKELILEDGNIAIIPEYPDFTYQYEQSRQISYQLMADSLTDIADDGTNDFMMRQSNSGEEYEVQNPEVLARSRLRVDTRKWFLSKVLPKMYGDKVTQVSEGTVDHKHSGTIEHKPAEGMNFGQVLEQREKLKLVSNN